jgi:hypothetical protein
MVAPCAVFAQAQAEPPAAPAAPAASAATVPLDQQPTKEQLAKMFELMRVKEQLASVTKMMPALMQQQMQAQFKQMQKDNPELTAATDEQQQAMAKVMSRFMERVMNLYTSDEMIADMSGLYQKHLTASDVDGIIAFYSSPAGKHVLDMAPVIMSEFMPTVMQRVQERIKPLTDEMEKEMKEVIGSPAPAPPAEKPVQK